MRESQREGLRAAARVAFAATVFGCGGSPPPEDRAVAVGAPSPAPTTGAAAAPKQAPPTCSEVIAAAFPTPGKYPGEAVAGADPELGRCCTVLLGDNAQGGPHLWDCCAQIDNLHGACTPWGPPTPPAIAAATKASRPGRALDLRSRAQATGLAFDAAGLAPGARDAAIATWHARMLNEHASSRVFEGLALQLAALGWMDASAEAAAFADEEVRHGVRCGAVVEALGGEARGVEADAEAFPRHPDAVSAREAALRNVLSIACLSETVAVALIGAERAAMPQGALRDLLTKIWADEIGHARFGWRVLDRVAPDLDEAERASLTGYLEVALEHLIEHELAHLPIGFESPEGGDALGLCSGREARALFRATLDEVLLPALAQRGFERPGRT